MCVMCRCYTIIIINTSVCPEEFPSRQAENY